MAVGTAVAVGGTGVAVAAWVVGIGVAVAVAVVVVRVVGVAVVWVVVAASVGVLAAAVGVGVEAAAAVLAVVSLPEVVSGAVVAVFAEMPPLEVTTGTGLEFTGLATSSPQAPREAARATATSPFANSVLTFLLFSGLDFDFSSFSLALNILKPLLLFPYRQIQKFPK